MGEILATGMVEAARNSGGGSEQAQSLVRIEHMLQQNLERSIEVNRELLSLLKKQMKE